MVDVRAAEARILGLRAQTVERMAELMQECLHLARSKKYRIIAYRLGEVHHDGDDRHMAIAFIVFRLCVELRHPCARTLTGTIVEVGIQHSEYLAVFVKHLEGLGIRMIGRDVFVALEGVAEKLSGESEYSVDGIVELEIGLLILYRYLENI